MTDRAIIYPGQITLEREILFNSRAAAEGQARLAMMLFGINTIVDGLYVSPTIPASLNVSVSPGTILTAMGLDPTAFSTLGADTRTILHQGISRDTVLLPITPPTGAGQSRVYLIQALCQMVDTDAVVLPYYNASNPDQAFSGPNNSGTPQNTTRAVNIVISSKAGTIAATGSQVAPSPDAGYVPLANVTVSNGAAQITAANISPRAETPRLTYYLHNLGVALANIVRTAGLSLDQTDINQVLSAIRATTFAKSMRVIETSQNIVVPNGPDRMRIRGWGGGGGGGGSFGANSVGAGGGGGAYFEGFIPVTAGQVIPITVGARGAAGSNAGGNGGTGGSTAVGSFVTVTGGQGGAGANGAVIAQPGGAFGTFNVTPGSNIWAYPGQGGATGFRSGTDGFCSGAGGDSPQFSSGGFSNSNGTTPVVGNNANNPGSGGGGGISGGNGGVGGPGLVILEW